jgi:hypothetical protein
MSLSPSAHAAYLAGVRLPEQESLEGHTLKLNGIALRQVTLFHVPVYVAGLYLERPAGSEYFVLGNHEIKELVMVFRHDAPAEKIADALRGGFKDNCGSASTCAEQEPQFARFRAHLRDMHPGESARLRIFPDRLEVAYGDRAFTIAGGEFANTVLASFIGKAGDDDVKRELLAARSAATITQVR